MSRLSFRRACCFLLVFVLCGWRGVASAQSIQELQTLANRALDSISVQEATLRKTLSAEDTRETQKLLQLSDAELESLLLTSPDKLGSISLGRPDAGTLLFPVQMPQGQRWNVVKASQAWGTRETVNSVIAVINKVHASFPDETQPLHVGDISRKRGGLFLPHKNHQNGRDVDLGFYYKEPTRWYRKAYHSNLDVPRTWALLRAIVTETEVELVYVDRFVISLVLQHARTIGEDEGWLQQIFRQPSPSHPRPLIRHEDGHRTHMHVRFFNPKAQRLAQRMHHLLEKAKMIRHPMILSEHVVKTGESVQSLARRYRTTRYGIRVFNKLTADTLVTGKTYTIPHQGVIEAIDEPIVIPKRLLPPAKQ